MDFFPKRSYFKKGDRVKADLSAFIDLGDMRPYGTITEDANEKGTYMVSLDYPIRWEDGELGREMGLKEYELEYLQPVEEAERLEGKGARLAEPQTVVQPPTQDYGSTWTTKPGTSSHEPWHIEYAHQGPPDNGNQDVNHPTHYTSDPSGIECIQITRWRNFNIGNAFKYLWRAGLKDTDTTIQDLQKAVWYIRDEIARLEETQ